MQTIKLWATKGHRQDMWLRIVDLRRMWGERGNARPCSLWFDGYIFCFEASLKYGHVLKTLFVRLMIVADCV